MAPKAVRNAAGTVIGLELPGDDHPDGTPAMIPVLPIPEGATVGEPEEEAAAADKAAALDAADRNELDELRAARDGEKAVDTTTSETSSKTVTAGGSVPPWLGASTPAPTA